MKILNILQGTSLGGMEQSSLELMRSMKRIGCDFEVLSLTPFGSLKTKLDIENIKAKDSMYKGLGGWRSFLDIKLKISETDAESIMMTGHSLIGMLALGKKCKGKRILAIHFHHQGVKNNLIWKIIYFIACKKFNRITFASEFIRDEAISIYSKVKKMSEVIHNPIREKALQDNDLKEISRKKLGLPADAIIFGNAGWLIKRKRFDVFINLARKIKDAHPSAKFLIAGDGEEKDNLLELAVNLGISDDIIWLGWQDNLDDFYNAIDFMIFNSDWDAVGLSPLESILKGIFTIISVKNGGIKEILKNDFSFFFHNNHDIKVMTNKITNIINNNDKYYDLLLLLRKHVMSISSPLDIAYATKKLYLKHDKKN
tara:strand:+ start:1042 stop:2151 length:1110 start_codon:yes stop_codon:yes gene_type:complete